MRSIHRMLRKDGATLLHVLLLVVMVGYLSSLAARGWTLAAKREREEELVFRAFQYRDAIERYWQFEGRRQFPGSIEALLLDPRSAGTLRHLRSAYSDPVTGKPFLLIREQGGGIVGVRSASEADPVRMFPVIPGKPVFISDGEGYSRWQFVFTPPRAPSRRPPTRGAP